MRRTTRLSVSYGLGVFPTWHTVRELLKVGGLNAPNLVLGIIVALIIALIAIRHLEISPARQRLLGSSFCAWLRKWPLVSSLHFLGFHIILFASILPKNWLTKVQEQSPFFQHGVTMVASSAYLYKTFKLFKHKSRSLRKTLNKYGSLTLTLGGAFVHASPLTGFIIAINPSLSAFRKTQVPVDDLRE